MAVFNVTNDNFRLEDAEDIGGVSSRGGGAGAAAEPQLAYQGGNAWNRKVTSSSGAGFEYDPISDGKSALDATVTGQNVWMFKGVVSDSPGLQPVDGFRAIWGDGSNEYAAIVAGSDAVKSSLQSYKLRTSTLIVPIALDIAAFQDPFHSGSGVNLASLTQIGVEAAFVTSQAKSENVGLDALDFGVGLIGVGGGGVDPAGDWLDFVAYDEGTDTNRFGYANSFESNLVLFGSMRIGDGVSAVVFNGTGKGVRPDGLYPPGWAVDLFDCTIAGTVITDVSDIESLGTVAGSDTRADVLFVGTVPQTISHRRANYRNYTMTNAITLDGADIEIVSLVTNGGTIQNSRIGCNALSGNAVCGDFAALTANRWVQIGQGHALRDTGAPGPRTLTSQTFEGFGGSQQSNAVPNSGPLDAAYFNDTGGHVDLSLSGGSSGISIRNGAGATTTIIDAATLSVVDVPNGLEARFRFGSVTMPGGYVASVTGNQFDLVYDKSRYGGRKVRLTIGGIAGDGTPYDRFEIDVTLPLANSTLPFLGNPNPSYVAA